MCCGRVNDVEEAQASRDGKTRLPKQGDEATNKERQDPALQSPVERLLPGGNEERRVAGRSGRATRSRRSLRPGYDFDGTWLLDHGFPFDRARDTRTQHEK